MRVDLREREGIRVGTNVLANIVLRYKVSGLASPLLKIFRVGRDAPADPDPDMNLAVHQFAFSPYCIPITASLDACGVAFSTVEVPIHRRDEIISLTKGRYWEIIAVPDIAGQVEAVAADIATELE